LPSMDWQYEYAGRIEVSLRTRHADSFIRGWIKQ